MPATQLALLALLEKEVTNFQFKLIRSEELALNHPLRAPPAVSASANRPALLPFLNCNASRSAMDGSELHDAVAIARQLEEQFRTGSRLVPYSLAQRQKMEQTLALVQQQIQPLLDVLLSEYIYGPSQGHRPDSSLIRSALAQLPSHLAQLEDSLAATAGPERSTRVEAYLAGDQLSVADLSVLPSCVALLQTPAASLFDDLPLFSALLVRLQQRSSWRRLQSWLAHNAGERMERFAQGEAGAPFES